MRYLALATDYDGTLAHHGSVDAPTLEALHRLRATGRKLIMVSGRQIDDLLAVFPDALIFDQIVAENGAVLYGPEQGETRLLAQPPPAAFVDALKERGVQPLATGHVVVATVQPNETVALQVIRELGLDLQVIFNKGSVMILPSSVNKATGLYAVLQDLRLSPHNVVGIGDAENDHAFLKMCECGVAVANALDAVKNTADFVTAGRASDGVRELIDRLVGEDLRSLDSRLTRHRIALGTVGDELVSISPYGPSVLVAGPSGSGKSTIVRGFLERLAEQRYQFCVVDPEGDYDQLGIGVTLGSDERAPSVDEAMRLLDDPAESVGVNLLGLRLHERPSFFHALLSRTQELRARTGRPHWLIIDEAHRLEPDSFGPAALSVPETLSSTMLITIHPDRLTKMVVDRIDLLLAVGAPQDVLRPFGQPTDIAASSGEAVIWSRKDGPPRRLQTLPRRLEQHDTARA